MQALALQIAGEIRVGIGDGGIGQNAQTTYTEKQCDCEPSTAGATGASP